MHSFCTIFWAFRDKHFPLCYILYGDSLCDILKLKNYALIPTIYFLHLSKSKLRHLARLLYVEQLVSKVGLLYSLNEQAFCQFLSDNKNTLQKPFDKYFDNENLQ